jgi:hypothetical protein
MRPVGFVAIVLALGLLCAPLRAQSGWAPLFNGTDLSGWYVCNGKAPYTVENGEVVGRTVVDSPNSFLCSKEKYGDFILEYEVWVDTNFNSGMQIRSIADPGVIGGRVHGLQVEVDPSDRAWSGGIYDEARRGWLYTNEGQDASRAGNVIRFRNVRIMTMNLEANRTPDRGDTPQVNHIPNTISAREATAGWKLLWDGKTTAGWRGAKLTAFPEKGWEIKNGVLSVLESEGKEAAAGGDIVTVDQFANFELIVEYSITRGANSGVKYFVDTTLNKGEGSSIGCEFQVLDDAVHPDAKLVVQGKHVEHWLNGFKTVEYERGTQMWRALVNYSKYAVWPAFGEAPKGHILLQDHGNRVSGRTIKIRELQ